MSIQNTLPDIPWSKDNLPWSWDRCKEWLTDEILAKNILDSMDADEVYNMRPEFRAFKVKNFRTNFTTLRKNIKKFGKDAERDDRNMQSDQSLHAVNSLGRWHGSDAQRLLKNDFETQKHLQYEGNFEEFWKSRPEYTHFPKRKVYDHLQQLKRAAKTKPHWLERKKKDLEEKEEKKAIKLLAKLESERNALIAKIAKEQAAQAKATLKENRARNSNKK